MTKEIQKDKTVPIFEKKDKKNFDFYISSSENIDITLTEQESIDLIARLDRGPNEKAQKFAKEAKEFYEENKKKVRLYLEKNDIK